MIEIDNIYKFYSIGITLVLAFYVLYRISLNMNKNTNILLMLSNYFTFFTSNKIGFLILLLFYYNFTNYRVFTVEELVLWFESLTLNLKNTLFTFIIASITLYVTIKSVHYNWIKQKKKELILDAMKELIKSKNHIKQNAAEFNFIVGQLKLIKINETPNIFFKDRKYFGNKTLNYSNAIMLFDNVYSEKYHIISRTKISEINLGHIIEENSRIDDFIFQIDKLIYISYDDELKINIDKIEIDNILDLQNKANEILEKNIYIITALIKSLEIEALGYNLKALIPNLKKGFSIKIYIKDFIDGMKKLNN